MKCIKYTINLISHCYIWLIKTLSTNKSTQTNNHHKNKGNSLNQINVIKEIYLIQNKKYNR